MTTEALSPIDMNCPKCTTQLALGEALVNPRGMADQGSQTQLKTRPEMWPPKLVECLKCPSCGYSETLPQQSPIAGERPKYAEKALDWTPEVMSSLDLSQLTVLGEAAINVSDRTPEEIDAAGAAIVAVWTGEGSNVLVHITEEGNQRVKRILLVRPCAG